MTPQEFKAWFDGFTEAFSGVPTKAQWARVKERVAEIDGKATTERVYVDRYWPVYSGYPRVWLGSATSDAIPLSYGTSNAVGSTNTYTANLCATGANHAVGLVAMANLGRADAAALAA